MTIPDTLFGFLIEDIRRLLRRNYETASHDRPLSSQQARVLASVSFNAGITQTALADRLDIQRISLTHLVDGLEAQKLVERRKDETDRRVWRLYLTPAAEPLLESLWISLSEISQEVLSVLPKARGDALIEDLSLVRNHLKQQQANNNKNGSA